MIVDGVHRNNTRVQIRVLGFEHCTRACDHCSLDSNPGLRNPSFKDLERWQGRIEWSSTGVQLTLGEPTIYSDWFKRKARNLSDVVRMILAGNSDTSVFINTSGIDFMNPIEAQTAIDLSCLPEEMRGRIKYNLTASKFPHYPSSRGREVLEETLEFLVYFFTFHLITFVGQEGLRRWLKAKLMSFGIKEDDVGRYLPGPRGVHKYGRAMTGKLYTEDGDYPPSNQYVDTCILKGHFGSEKLALMPDGIIVPGCVMIESPFLGIAHINDSPEEIREKTRLFRSEVTANQLRHPPSCLSCIKAAAELGTLRHEERLLRCVPYSNIVQGIIREARIPSRRRSIPAW